MLRLFIALAVPAADKRAIGRLQQKARACLEGIRMVRAEGLHLTLKFLGETEPQRLEQIKVAIDEAAGASEIFSLALGGIGVFPSPAKARVLWVGLRSGEKAISALAGALDRSLAICGFQPEKRPFHPHLTIGRLRRPVSGDKLKRFIEAEKDFEGKTFLVDRVILFKSTLTAGGAVHEALYQKEL